MRPDLPSLMSLLAFEAAARHLSFTSAGRELDLTQTAISHQIKNLEQRLGIKLFVRRRNTLQLTTPGRLYLDAVREAINVLHGATNRTKREKNFELLTVHCLPTYATQCLIPALTEFQGLYPDITVQLITSQTFDQFKRRSYDVAFRYGTGQWPDLQTDLLHVEQIFPVCAPALADQIDHDALPASLAGLTQIRTYFQSTYQDDWPNWLEAAGMATINFGRETIFNLQLTSQQAALHGVGVALGRSPLVDTALANGTLCEPFQFRLRTGSAYYLVSPPERATQEKVGVFREWALRRLRMPSQDASA